MFDIVSHTIASNVANAATFTVAYPTGRSKADYRFGRDHALSVGQALHKAPSGVGVSFGASNITVTNRTGGTLSAGTVVKLQLDTLGAKAVQLLNGVAKGVLVTTAMLTLGAPITLDADGLIAAATSTELPNNATITYTFATGGTSPLDGANQTGVLDVPRNITATVTHGSSVVAMTIALTGLDVYGKVLKETLTIPATGTSQAVAGVKAFAALTSIAITSAGNATTNTLNLGWGNVFGLPVRLPDNVLVLKEIVDGDVPADAGTFTAGVAHSTVASATSADVRGTYAPHSNNAADGSKEYVVLLALPDAEDLGPPQFSG